MMREPIRLARLDKEERLMYEGQLDGLVLGEAAGFLLLSTGVAAKKYKLKPQLDLGLSVSGLESGHRYSMEPYRGEGLVKAFTEATKNATFGPVDIIYSTLNG